MKTSELRRKSGESLEKMVRDQREKLRQLRFDLAAGKVKNIKEIRQTRKEIARTCTVLGEMKEAK